MKAKKNAIEWAVFTVSAIIVAALIAYLVAQSLQPAADQPELRVTTGTAEQRGQLWSVPVTVENTTDQTAEEVQIEIAVRRDGADVETAVVTLAFVPRHSRREAWAMFRTDPRGLEIVARGLAFKKP